MKPCICMYFVLFSAPYPSTAWCQDLNIHLLGDTSDIVLGATCLVMDGPASAPSFNEVSILQ